jgi:hypothetical protein
MNYLRITVLSVLLLFIAAPAMARDWSGVDCDGLKSAKNQAACWKAQALSVAEPESVPIPGAKGDKGEKGDAGLSIVGATGAKGDAGVKGDKGDTGATGATGPAGPAGADGAAGADGRGFASGTILLVRDDCPAGMTLVGTRNEWGLYNVVASGRPWSGGTWSQLFVSLCSVN